MRAPTTPSIRPPRVRIPGLDTDKRLYPLLLPDCIRLLGKPFRGPDRFTVGSYVYLNASRGTIGRFRGRERITEDDKPVHELCYAGGLLGWREAGVYDRFPHTTGRKSSPVYDQRAIVPSCCPRRSITVIARKDMDPSSQAVPTALASQMPFLWSDTQTGYPIPAPVVVSKSFVSPSLPVGQLV